MTAIQIENLKKYFGKVKAVDGISLDIEDGEVFGYLGPNGAGKTTTIACIMDFLRPDEGKILINGLDARAESTALKAIMGYIPADVRLYENWNGWDHLNMIENLRGKSTILPQLVRDFQFDPNVKVKNLSTGNKQKLSIIMALMPQPHILILDEPTRGLDPLLQNAFFRWLQAFKEAGATVFMSSHNLNEVEHVCSRVAIIKAGKLVTIENIKDMKGKRVLLVTAEFDEVVKPSVFKLENVEIVEQFENRFVFKNSGDINPLLKVLAKYKVRDLEIDHATLEDIFLEFYN
jgi:ABC-2 type transport system ATP-binding protein